MNVQYRSGVPLQLANCWWCPCCRLLPCLVAEPMIVGPRPLQGGQSRAPFTSQLPRSLINWTTKVGNAVAVCEWLADRRFWTTNWWFTDDEPLSPRMTVCWLMISWWMSRLLMMVLINDHPFISQSSATDHYGSTLMKLMITNHHYQSFTSWINQPSSDNPLLAAGMTSLLGSAASWLASTSAGTQGSWQESIGLVGSVQLVNCLDLTDCCIMLVSWFSWLVSCISPESIITDQIRRSSSGWVVTGSCLVQAGDDRVTTPPCTTTAMALWSTGLWSWDSLFQPGSESSELRAFSPWTVVSRIKTI